VAAPTFADARDVCFEGESGLVSVIPENCIDNWNRSIGELILKNKSRFDLLSADEPERVRGRQYHRSWTDELASFRGRATGKRDATGSAIAGTPDQMFTQIRLATRLPSRIGPRIIVTTTPKVLSILKALKANPRTFLTTGSTYENRDNLAGEALQDWIDLYEGTRLGRQELHAEILEEIEGALWTRIMLEEARLDPKKDQLPSFRRVVIAIDPQATANKRSSETGIVAVGLAPNGRACVLQDGSGSYSPDQWAAKALSMYTNWNASRIVGEINNGGDMVEAILRSKAPNVSYKHVSATKGKIVRAEPVSHLYERHLVDHWGAMPLLEDQMCSFTGEEGEVSPDHLDALVWALTELCLTTRNKPLVGPGAPVEQSNHWTSLPSVGINLDDQPAPYPGTGLAF
jgi:phage terminase large subunit-like protein